MPGKIYCRILYVPYNLECKTILPPTYCQKSTLVLYTGYMHEKKYYSQIEMYTLGLLKVPIV